MSFILSDARDSDPSGSFDRYRTYIESERHRFPPSALTLIDSDWYFGSSDPGAPHDSWLEDIRVVENRGDGRNSAPETSICIRLLGSGHDGIIEFVYSHVTSYTIHTFDLSAGHCDWRYDEFRISEQGDLIHEIEWCGAGETGRWVIYARDVFHHWHPF